MDALPVLNEAGEPHMHNVGLPDAEASEMASHISGMRTKNTDHKGIPVFSPVVKTGRPELHVRPSGR